MKVLLFKKACIALQNHLNSLSRFVGLFQDLCLLCNHIQQWRWSRKSFQCPPADKQACNYDTQCSNQHPSLPPKDTWIEPQQDKVVNYIYENLPRHTIVRLPQPRSRDSQGKLFLPTEMTVFKLGFCFFKAFTSEIITSSFHS